MKVNKKKIFLILMCVSLYLLYSCIPINQEPGIYKTLYLDYENYEYLVPNVQRNMLGKSFYCDRKDYNINLSVDNEEVATIDSNGVLTTHNFGTVIVHISIKTVNGILIDTEEDTITVIDEFSYFTEYTKERLLQKGLDTDHNGEISISEIREVKKLETLYFFEFNDLSLYIPNIEYLRIKDVDKSIDVSGFKKLKTLIVTTDNWFDDPDSKNFEIIGNDSLESLEVNYYEQYKPLDIRQCKNITHLAIRWYIYSKQKQDILLNENNHIEKLITEDYFIDLSDKFKNLKYLDVNYGDVLNLNHENCPLLDSIHIYGRNAYTLDLSGYKSFKNCYALHCDTIILPMNLCNAESWEAAGIEELSSNVFICK